MSFKALLLTFALTQGADLTTTLVGLKQGCHEANPLYGTNPSPTTMVARKTASFAIIGSFAWGMHKRGNTRMAKTILWTGIGVTGGAAALNLHRLGAGC